MEPAARPLTISAYLVSFVVLASSCHEPAAPPAAAAAQPATPIAEVTPAASAPVASAPAADSAAAPVTSAPPADAAAAAGNDAIPSACVASPEGCVPPFAFTRELCKNKYADLALVLLSKRMPWQRAYVKAEWIEPVNVYGGVPSEAWLHFGEEVAILHKHVPGDRPGVKVSGPSDVDILRWDGTCATIRQEMLVSTPTGQMDSPRIVWKYLDAQMSAALLMDAHVKQASDKERRLCKGSSVTHPEEPCDKAMKDLTAAIMSAVKAGLALPEPERRPHWHE